MRLKGHTELKINGKTVFEKDNALTPFVNDILLGQGNFHDLANREKLLPVKQFFEGCLLTDGANSHSTATSLIDHNSIVTACADNTNNYTGSSTIRGSMVSSQDITGGHKFIWSWSGSQGNGDIGSVCLCRPILAISDPDYIYEGTPVEGNPINEYLGDYIAYTDSDSDIVDIMKAIRIIDYDRELAYTITHPVAGDGTFTEVTIKAYSINTYQNHLSGEVAKIRSKTPVSETTLTLDSALHSSYVSFSWTGDNIHIIGAVNANQLIDYIVDVESWTIDSKITRTYSELTTFSELSTGGVIVKDSVIVDETNRYFYAFAYPVGSPDLSLVRLSMDSDVVLEVIGTYNIIDIDSAPSLWLGNGDFIKFGMGNDSLALFYHAGKGYVVSWDKVSCNAICGTNHGTAVFLEPNGMVLGTVYPFITTVNNLNSLVTKRPGDVMTLEYTITEVENE